MSVNVILQQHTQSIPLHLRLQGLKYMPASTIVNLSSEAFLLPCHAL
jgi:hypothetical protein